MDSNGAWCCPMCGQPDVNKRVVQLEEELTKARRETIKECASVAYALGDIFGEAPFIGGFILELANHK